MVCGKINLSVIRTVHKNHDRYGRLDGSEDVTVDGIVHSAEQQHERFVTRCNVECLQLAL